MQGLHLSESCRQQVAALPAGTRHPGAAPSLKLRELHSSRSERGRSTRYHALLAAAKFADCLVRDKMKIGRFFSRRLTIVTLAAAGLVGWLGRETLLREAAVLWIVSDPLTYADAIVVLGGNSQTRPPVAADLYPRGPAKKVLGCPLTYFPLNRPG